MNLGVDWTAPAGTPVVAAFAGQVRKIETAGGRLTANLLHDDKSITVYSGLSGLASGIEEGVTVRPGQKLGVLAPGASGAEPRLHFELLRKGRQVDPFGTYQAQIEKGGAIDGAVRRIIHIESANNCNAKNQLSTATGLGQFINSTWLRIIRDHRPDIHAKFSPQEILAMRTDCDLAFEMTTALTRENAAYLRSTGAPVTPGNLYLAHFLGPGGAAKALTSAGTSAVAMVMGEAVVNANPFLKGKSIEYLVNWAARKMEKGGSGKIALSGAPPETAVIRYANNPAFKQFKEAVSNLLL
jgi:murein DD-endopeptidase MepM/ murein hydrolase activator NlpD